MHLKRKFLIWLLDLVKSMLSSEVDMLHRKVIGVEENQVKTEEALNRQYDLILQRQIKNTLDSKKKIKEIESEIDSLKKLL